MAVVSARGGDPLAEGAEEGDLFGGGEFLDALKQVAFSLPFAGKGADDKVRIWVPDCATGEVAYSVAMLMLEHASTMPDPPSIRVFATDTDEEAISWARRGWYQGDFDEWGSALPLHMFFNREAGGVRVDNKVRELMVFATHDLITNPPISHLDLIVCPAFLAHANPGLRDRVLKLFYYALRPEGRLFLSNPKTVLCPELFTATGEGRRVYSANGVSSFIPPLCYYKPGKGRGGQAPSERSAGGPGGVADVGRRGDPSHREIALQPGTRIRQARAGARPSLPSKRVNEFEILKRQGDELRERGELLNLAHDAIIVTNLADRVLFWNFGAEQLYGWAEEEAVGRTATELWQPIYPKPLEEIRKALLLNNRWDGELSHLRRDGTRAAVASRWALRWGADGQFKILQINLDISNRKGVEAERTHLIRRLALSQEEERRRLSRELHDSIGQQLTVLRMEIDALREIGQDQRLLNEQVDALNVLARRLDADVDYLAWNLRPTSPDDFDLVAAISSFLREWSKRFGVSANFHAGGLSGQRLAPEVEMNLYRITQEALNNVSKHARARCVDVILELRNNLISLIIEDDGVGFEPDREGGSARSFKGLGLVGMRERVSLLGGAIEIESSSAGGATVYVRVPTQDCEIETYGKTANFISR